jgi:hypothetical protein
VFVDGRLQPPPQAGDPTARDPVNDSSRGPAFSRSCGRIPPGRTRMDDRYPVSSSREARCDPASLLVGPVLTGDGPFVVTAPAAVDRLLHVSPVSGLRVLPRFVEVRVCPALGGRAVDVGRSAAPTRHAGRPRAVPATVQTHQRYESPDPSTARSRTRFSLPQDPQTMSTTAVCRTGTVKARAPGPRPRRDGRDRRHGNHRIDRTPPRAWL